MIHEGLIKEGLQIAKEIFQTTYCDRGYLFRTPEAWTVDGRFRANIYATPCYLGRRIRTAVTRFKKAWISRQNTPKSAEI